MVKNLSTNAGNIRDVGLNPGSRRSPGGGHGDPLQYSCLENPKDRAMGLQRVGHACVTEQGRMVRAGGEQ